MQILKLILFDFVLVPQTGLDYMYFMRSSGSFTHSHTTHYWMGDQLVTFDDFDGMRSAIVAMLSAGM